MNAPTATVLSLAQLLAWLSHFGTFGWGKAFLFNKPIEKVWPTNAACRKGIFRAGAEFWVVVDRVR
jgi:hypothetical protein